jgi:hypothetical protein
MQSFVQQDSCVVPRKRASGSVGAVHPRGEADDQQPGSRIAEGRNRPAMIVGVLFPDDVKKRGQPRAFATVRVEYVSRHVSPAAAMVNYVG